LGKLIRDGWVKRKVYGGEKGKSGYVVAGLFCWVWEDDECMRNKDSFEK